MAHLAYLRVSTDAQDQQSQEAQILEWANRTGTTIANSIHDRASGALPWEKRRLAETLDGCREGDTIVVSEISRIARSTIGVLGFLREAADRGIHVVAIRNGIAIDDSIGSKVLVTIFALVAEIERDFIRARTTAALAARRASGVTLGRPRGARSISKIAAKAGDIRALLAANVSKRAIARLLGCSPQTLYKYLADDPGATGDIKTLPLFEATQEPTP
jgi:DNA invertase Pin-like site-specific DNA recombinase